MKNRDTNPFHSAGSRLSPRQQSHASPPAHRPLYTQDKHTVSIYLQFRYISHHWLKNCLRRTSDPVLTSLLFLCFFLLLSFSFLKLCPLHTIFHFIKHHSCILWLFTEPWQKILGRDQDLNNTVVSSLEDCSKEIKLILPIIIVYIYLCVLFYKFCEVIEEGVLGSQEIKLVVPLFSVHQVCQKLASISGHKLSCQFHYITANKYQMF